MKNLLIFITLASAALCLLLCFSFDKLQADSKANVERAEADVAAIERLMAR
jgi:hypothetical protein